MKFLTFDRTRYGWRIKDDDGHAVHYIGYTRRRAEKAFRNEFNLNYKHFERIYI